MALHARLALHDGGGGSSALAAHDDHAARHLLALEAGGRLRVLAAEHHQRLLRRAVVRRVHHHIVAVVVGHGQAALLLAHATRRDPLVGVGRVLNPVEHEGARGARWCEAPNDRAGDGGRAAHGDAAALELRALHCPLLAVLGEGVEEGEGGDTAALVTD